MIDSKLFLIEPLISPEALETVPWTRAWLSGLAGLAGTQVSPYGMHDSEARREGLPAQRQSTPDPVRKCCQDPDSGAECRKEDLCCIIGR